MLVAAGAVLLPLDALRVQALVLVGEVIAIFADLASEDDLFACHFELPFLNVKSVRVGLLLSGSRQPELPAVSPDARALVELSNCGLTV